MDITKHKSYKYCLDVINNKVVSPKYVKLQCQEFLDIANDKNDKYMINLSMVSKIDKLLKLIKMPKGLKVGQSFYKTLAGFQWLLIIASLCIVYRDNPKHRRYETCLLEICRKNGKTQIVGLMFVILLLLEPKFSSFYGVAPDGAISAECKKAVQEILSYNINIFPQEGPDKMFKIRRDDIECLINNNKYIPLNYSTQRMDSRLASVYVADEVGALPNSYAIEAMRSSQLTILNKLGFIISTKYPTVDNPLEDEVKYAKAVLDKRIEDDKVFALLYEPDNTDDWENDDDILKQGNPLAQEVPEIWEDLLAKRQRAIEMPSARVNFLTKHCNIIYQDLGVEAYINVEAVKKCKVENINWRGRQVYLGLDLSMSGDNTAVSMITLDDDEETILAESFCFIPHDRIEEKTKFEHIDYRRFIEEEHKCFACGELTIDYGYIENFIMQIESKYGVEVVSVGYDRWNCLSTAQKLEESGINMVEVKQHSSVLHAPTKYLKEKILDGKFRYCNNTLLEINFSNARCMYDTNQNMYVNKKKSKEKVDMVVSMLNAMYLLQQDEVYGSDFVAVSF